MVCLKYNITVFYRSMQGLFNLIIYNVNDFVFVIPLQIFRQSNSDLHFGIANLHNIVVSVQHIDVRNKFHILVCQFLLDLNGLDIQFVILADLCCKFDFCLCLPRALEFLYRVLTGFFLLSGGFRPGGVQGHIFIPHITVVFRNQGILIIFLIGLLVIVPNSPINIRLHSTAAVAFGVPAVKGIPLSYGNIGQK